MTRIICTDRSRIQAAQRCRRLRWLEYHEGAGGMGLTPAKRSSHLVVGGAVHAGMEQLLKLGQEWLWQNPDMSVADLFSIPTAAGSTLLLCRQIEDRAVAAALAEFSQSWSDGVELDPEEARQRAAAAGQPEMVNDFADLLTNPIGGAGVAGSGAMGESPIVVDFADFSVTSPEKPLGERLMEAAAAYQSFDQDAWLKEEMAALVEGLTRCWARRRWRSTLEQFEVLEVEREGEWRLGEWVEPHFGGESDEDGEFYCMRCGVLIDDSSADCLESAAELHFLSRHDALLLERSTGYLYLQSYKTTGSWDRRKELDAQVDMQGLSEAVDVEKRFGEAWRLQKDNETEDGDGEQSIANDRVRERNARVDALVSPRVAQWLSTLPDPPTILGVRYEYLLKGSRKENKKAQPGEPRWNQESVLVRAWKQEGITAEDRRWAWSYDWVDEAGKSRRLDYRSWQKAAVWRAMPVADWIDLLDAGKVQEGAVGENGELLDALAAQLVPVMVAYRSSDEMLDLLEQLEAQEVQVAKDVEAVREAEKAGGYSAKRTELNRRFSQNRQACSYPGLCPYRTTATQPGFCFGPPDAEHDPSVLEHYRTRRVNHPAEAGLVQIKEAV